MKKNSDYLIELQRRNNMHIDEISESRQRKAASMKKTAENNRLYLEGYRAGLKGEQPLESFVELVDENGQMVQMKDHRNFKNGYLNGQKELENQLAMHKSSQSR